MKTTLGLVSLPYVQNLNCAKFLSVLVVGCALAVCVLRHLSMSSGESRLEDNVFDLNADDEEGIKKKRATYHWDRRKKKYIKLNAGDEAINKGSRMVVSQGKMRLLF